MKTNKLIPKLRFKEFSGEWEEKKLGEVYTFKPTNTFSRENLNYEKGVVKNIHYGDIHTKFSTLFDITKERVPFVNLDININRIANENYCQEGDIIFADASEDLKDVGKSIEIVNTNNEKLVSGLHTLLARKKEPKSLLVGFGGHLFKSNSIRSQIQRESQGAKVLGISAGRLSNIIITYPTIPEQTKIAAFLTSLDDLIAAEQQKLSALKTHKKGLMQQLFPAAGEKVPRLRFEGFEGEWEEKMLGEVAKYENGQAHEQDIIEEGDYIVVNSKFISTNGIIKKFANNAWMLSKKEDILMVLSDIPKGGALAKCFFVDKDETYTVNQRICKITQNKVYPKLLFYILDRNSYFLSFDDKVNQTNLRKEDVLNCPILLPTESAEQTKIASFLTSLDDLIAAQGEKIEALKRQKKGLMQQLFPSIKE